ncbi:MAG: phosphodiester glycosidase family protein [Scytolyngbya sp. HA4215-MV1]|nr:phosphodiester glycosidase family protein [Scytolyngbya sp. HA4215-MV1]
MAKLGLNISWQNLDRLWSGCPQAPYTGLSYLGKIGLMLVLLGGAIDLRLDPAIASEPPDLITVPRRQISQQSVSPTPTPAPSTQTFIRQGTQVSVNGRTLPVAWAQWQVLPHSEVRTGISDAGLMRLFGFRLLSTLNAAVQPIEWFAPPTNLPTLLTGQSRYLDISILAQDMGWQYQSNGSVLQLTSPPSRVMNVRQGKQPWGDRVVVDLDRPTPWQAEQQQDFSVTLDAAIDATLLTHFQAGPGNLLTSLKLETSANKTILRLGIPGNIRPRLSTLTNPHRLVIDVRDDSMVTQEILWAPGLFWRQQILTVGAAQFPVVWFAVNPRQSGLRIKPILPNAVNIQGTAPLSQTAQQAQVAAAINGGFFNRKNQLPLGIVRRDGRWVSGPILNRGAIAWNENGDFRFDRFNLQETVITSAGQRFPLTYLNSAFVKAGIARYTPDWGTSYMTLSDNEILIGVQNNRVVSQQTAAAVGLSSPIPTNGYLLVFRSNKTAADSFPKDTLLQIESATTPADFSRYPNIVGGGPLLLRNRQMVVDAAAEGFSPAFIRETAPRSAIGRTADGTILIVAVHKKLGGAEVSLNEIAQIMQQLGAIDALNLDGGSSTTLYLGGQLLDRPPQTAARVHNGIGVFVQPSP